LFGGLWMASAPTSCLEYSSIFFSAAAADTWGQQQEAREAGQQQGQQG
jgi:hypothetical protein